MFLSLQEVEWVEKQGQVLEQTNRVAEHSVKVQIKWAGWPSEHIMDFPSNINL